MIWEVSWRVKQLAQPTGDKIIWLAEGPDTQRREITQVKTDLADTRRVSNTGFIAA